MPKQWTFDRGEAQRLTAVRQAAVAEVLADLRQPLALGTALDVGCGVGYFSAFLREKGFNAVALDGRKENVAEARRRFPAIDFRVANIEDPAVQGLGTFDLVFCVGLLYHLENPFRAIRNLAALTGKVALIESMCVPGSRPLLNLLDEGATEDQGLRYVAFYPTEACLVKMFYRAGFTSIYRFRRLPAHEAFRETRSQRRQRTMLAASKLPLTSTLLVPLPEPVNGIDPWSTPWLRFMRPAGRLGRFLRKPWRHKVGAIGRLWTRTFPQWPFPVRLPFGGWWLARDDAAGAAILAGDYEPAECRFAQQFLRPGMVVLDVGAHHGFYTLLASRKVGREGHVFAFEPSPREHGRLLAHLQLNRCTNVQAEQLALGSREGEAELFLVEGRETGCNSLRRPQVADATRAVRVPVATLDAFLSREKIERVDFIKMDAEGGEREVLRGGIELLERRPRPVILCEVQNLRTAAWGYLAGEIVAFLRERGFQWFAPLADETLEPLPASQVDFDGNFVAVPEERLDQLQPLMK